MESERLHVLLAQLVSLVYPQGRLPAPVVQLAPSVLQTHLAALCAAPEHSVRLVRNRALNAALGLRVKPVLASAVCVPQAGLASLTHRGSRKSAASAIQDSGVAQDQVLVKLVLRVLLASQDPQHALFAQKVTMVLKWRMEVVLHALHARLVLIAPRTLPLARYAKVVHTAPQDQLRAINALLDI